MIVLGSTYLPIMQALARKLDANTELRAFDPGRPLTAQVADVDVLMIGSFRIGVDVLESAPKLQLMHQHGRGVDSVDRIEAARRGIQVANVPSGNSVAVAELTFALLLYMAKGFQQMPGAIQAGLTGAPPGLELQGKTLGIIGLGGAGTELARRASCFGMRVLATRANPTVNPHPPVEFLGGPADLHRVLEQSDFVSLLTTLTESTRGMIGRSELELMKPTAILINTARGPLVEYDALLQALMIRQIAGAAFDTFWGEPADPRDAILGLPNFFLSPHVAGFSDASIDHVTNVVSDNIRRLRAGEPLLNVVGPP